VRTQIVVERDCHGEPVAGAPFADRIEELGRRNDATCRAEVIELRFEKAGAKDGYEVMPRIPGGITDAVVNESERRFRRRATRGSCVDIAAEAKAHFFPA
jgi:hypothetical protein